MPTPARRPHLDRLVAISNVSSGSLLLLILVALGSWPLALIGWVFVLATSLFLGFMLAGDVVSASARAIAFGVPWLAVVALWTWLLYPISQLHRGGLHGTGPADSTLADHLITLGLAISIATSCFLVWQLCSWAVWLILANRTARRASLQTV